VNEFERERVLEATLSEGRDERSEEDEDKC
jgi:hypothetical protein